MTVSAFPLGAVPIAAIIEGLDFSEPSLFQGLLANPSAPRIFLVEVKSYDGGQEVTHFFSAPGPGR